MTGHQARAPIADPGRKETLDISESRRHPGFVLRDPMAYPVAEHGGDDFCVVHEGLDGGTVGPIHLCLVEPWGRSQWWSVTHGVIPASSTPSISLL